MSLINTNYFESKNVKVFPASFRNNYTITSGEYTSQSYQFDPEARLNTEYNLRHIGGASAAKDTFIVNWKITSPATDSAHALGTLACVIGGYYFEISNVDLYDFIADTETGKAVKNLYIKLREITLKSDTDSTTGAGDIDSTRTTKVLSSFNGNTTNLDYYINEEGTVKYYFTGLYVAKSCEGAEAYLVPIVLDNEGTPMINHSAFLPNIRSGSGYATTPNGTEVNAIEVGEGTVASGEASFAEGKTTMALGAFSHAEGTATTALSTNAHAEGVNDKTVRLVIKQIDESNPSEYKIKLNTVDYGSGKLIAGNILEYQAQNESYYYTIKSVDEATNTVAVINTDNDKVLKLRGTENEYIIVALGIAGQTGTTIAAHSEGIDNIASGNGAHAEGQETRALGVRSHSEGYQTVASGDTSHAEGTLTVASAVNAHAEGINTKATAQGAHAEGTGTTASNTFAHAEGSKSIASGQNSHAEGWETNASGMYSHTEGSYTAAKGNSGHAEGCYTTAYASNSHAEGDGSPATLLTAFTVTGSKSAKKYNTNVAHSLKVGDVIRYNDKYAYVVSVPTTTSFTTNVTLNSAAAITGKNIYKIVSITFGQGSHIEGRGTTAVGVDSHAEGLTTYAVGDYSHAEGNVTSARGQYAHAEGDSTIAFGQSSHAEGINTAATNTGAHAEGSNTKAMGGWSHAEGLNTSAVYSSSHAEGEWATTSANGSHAEGYYTYTRGSYAHAEGDYTNANGAHSHAEGSETTASGPGSHAEGFKTTASGAYSHSEGDRSAARGDYSHAEGSQCSAKKLNSHAEGNGTNADARDSHAEGSVTTVEGEDSWMAATSGPGYYARHAEGIYTKAQKAGSHAEGIKTVASGQAAHAEGSWTTASGYASHAGGDGAEAQGNYSFAHGLGVIANNSYEVVVGTYNKYLPSDNRLFVVGAGKADVSRANAFEVTKEKNEIVINNTKKDIGYDLKIGETSLNDIIRGNLLDVIYPVGSIYVSTTQDDNTKNTGGKYGCPIATNLGGTWERVQGEFLYAAEVNKGTNDSGSAAAAYGIGRYGGTKDWQLIKHNHGGSTGSTSPKTGNATPSNSNGRDGTLQGDCWFIEAEDDSELIEDCHGMITAPRAARVSGTNKYLDQSGKGGNGFRFNVDARHTHTVNYHTHSISEDGTCAKTALAGKNMPPYLCVYVWKRTA